MTWARRMARIFNGYDQQKEAGPVDALTASEIEAECGDPDAHPHRVKDGSCVERDPDEEHDSRADREINDYAMDPRD